MSKFQTIKIWKVTLKTLYFIKAHTGESIAAIIDRLSNQELERVSSGNDKRDMG